MDLFISDLHLCNSRPRVTRAFLDFLDSRARDAKSLYILGDLFEYWAGDDALEEHANVIDALRALTGAGVPVHFMAGNRDFLVGDGFAQATGCTLLDEPARLLVYLKPTLLLHGDTLCTGDADYQSFRAHIRAPAWRDQFLARPLAERKREIEELRRRSEQRKTEKPAKIMDVSPVAVAAELARNACLRLIHGHTHRTAHHEFEVNGQACERWVLSDWSEAHGANCLVVDFDGARFERIEI